MRFWDTSALVPLCVDEPESVSVNALLRDDPSIVVWWGSIIECWSALARRRREGMLQNADEECARTLLRTLQESWIEVLPGEDVRARAGRLLRLHPIRSADAVQLAAALVWAGDPPSGEIVVYDRRLREAARLEGLTPRP
jgi:predicted nucleic acid-binding protein